MMAVNYRAALFYFAFLVLVPVLRANIAEYDEVWRRRAEEAKKAINEAYHPNPHEVVQEFNKHVHHDIKSHNSTRRSLRRGRGGPCEATNPIDRCWRCQPDWATNRKRLADCALGFGRSTTGGKDGRFYVVTDASDDDVLAPKPGTLRHAVIQPEPLWITFAHDMIIRLKEELMVTNNKTIDGRGANVRIAFGAQITLQFVQNVIIHNIHVHNIIPGVGGLIRDSADHSGFRTRSDGDGVSIFGSSNIWIDHLSMSRCSDGLIDAVQASTGITISNSHFTNHNEVMLFGGSNIFSDDKKMQITLAFNHFGVGLVQRMPRCRWGFIHVVNNDYTHWLMYAIGGNQQPTILSQGNRFIAPMNDASKEVTKREYTDESQWKTWQWQSENDLMVNGAFFVQSGSPILNVNPQDMIRAKPGTFVTRLTRYSGALDCFPNKPC